MSDSQASLHETWRKIVAELVALTQAPDSQLAPLGPQHRAYLNLVKPVALVEGVAVLAVPHTGAKEFIETKLSNEITQALSQKLGRNFALAVTIDPSITQEETPVEHEERPSETDFMHTENTYRPHEDTPQPARQFRDNSGRYDQDTTLHSGPTSASELTHENAEHFVEQHRAAETPNWNQSYPQQQPSSPLPNIENSRSEGQGSVPNQPISKPQTENRDKEQTPADVDGSLNTMHTFDNYVVSDSNKLPASAAIAVAEKPARAYNPLFIWGDSGLGKTHLMHAIGNYAHQLHPRLRIKYVSSEEFTNDYINSVRDNRQEGFKRRYRDVDILMVDDIQFLQGKEGTQEEFFHTFNALEQGGKQIVLSSDRPPKQLTTLEDRLRTRFQAGLIADIYPPDLETRIAILSKKSRADGIETDREVLELIATRFASSIRELEGAFIRVSAYASVNKLELNRETAEIALRNISPDQPDVEITPETIIEVTAEYFQIKPSDLKGTTKTRNIAHARQIAMYLCRELTELSLPKIGESFGGKDHTTVMYADRKIRKDIAEKQATYNEIQQITLQIKGQAAG